MIWISNEIMIWYISQFNSRTYFYTCVFIDTKGGAFQICRILIIISFLTYRKKRKKNNESHYCNGYSELVSFRLLFALFWPRKHLYPRAGTILCFLKRQLTNKLGHVSVLTAIWIPLARSRRLKKLHTAALKCATTTTTTPVVLII